MRYAELDEHGKVRFVLPSELAGAYKVLPPHAVEILEDADIRVGDKYMRETIDGKALAYFAPETKGEIDARVKAAFDIERAQRFQETAWVRERHADREEMAIDDDVNWRAWLAYWQALRDMPEIEGFDARNPTWPEIPK